MDQCKLCPHLIIAATFNQQLCVAKTQLSVIRGSLKRLREP